MPGTFKGASEVARKFVYIIVGLAVALTALLGVRWYTNAQNTPEKRTASFIADLSKGDADMTYERFTPKFKKIYSKTKWSNYVASFKNSDQVGEFEKQEHIKDDFNTYPKDGDPRRLTYTFKFQKMDYLVTVVTYKQDNIWVIDDVQGDYR